MTDRTQSRLNVHNAEIKTATVEVRTLTISGKQVTLAVFRQLQSSDWLDGEMTPRGDAWGTVNYHPDKCADGRSHLHVVWQSGTDLRRAYLEQETHGTYAWPLDRTAEQRTLTEEARECLFSRGKWCDSLRTGLIIRRCPLDEGSYVFVEGARSSYDEGWVRDIAERDHARRHPSVDLCHDLDRRLEEAVANEMARLGRVVTLRDRRKQAWEKAEALPQLFIAV